MSDRQPSPHCSPAGGCSLLLQHRNSRFLELVRHKGWCLALDPRAPPLFVRLCARPAPNNRTVLSPKCPLAEQGCCFLSIKLNKRPKQLSQVGKEKDRGTVSDIPKIPLIKSTRCNVTEIFWVCLCARVHVHVCTGACMCAWRELGVSTPH